MLEDVPRNVRIDDPPHGLMAELRLHESSSESERIETAVERDGIRMNPGAFDDVEQDARTHTTPKSAKHGLQRDCFSSPQAVCVHSMQDSHLKPCVVPR